MRRRKERDFMQDLNNVIITRYANYETKPSNMDEIKKDVLDVMDTLISYFTPEIASVTIMSALCLRAVYECDTMSIYELIREYAIPTVVDENNDKYTIYEKDHMAYVKRV